jgi:hypothetical protein
MATQAQIAEARGIKVTKEEYIPSTQNGTSPGMTGNPQSDYAKRFYKMPAPTDPDMYPSALTDLQDAHDRLAFVTGLECGPLTMEARKRWGNDIVREAKQLQDGSNISDKGMQHLLKVHDGVSKTLGMQCCNASCNSPQERLLAQHQRNLKAMQETHNQRMQELHNLIQQPKRPYYRPGDYLRENVRKMDRAELLDRSRPWPEWIDTSPDKQDLERLLSELQVEYLGLYDAMHGLTADGPTRFWQ